MYEHDKMIKNRTFLNLPEGRFSLLILCLIFILGACGPAGEEENNTNTTPTTSDSYPAASNESVGYPPIGATASESESAAYPPPVALDKPLFQLDLPLRVGATTVSGQAPESLPLAIVDVTFGGVILGTGQSDENGRFSIPVTPLPDGHRIGVTITELEAGITFEEIAEQYFPYRGEGFMNIPNLGIFYDSAITEP